MRLIIDIVGFQLAWWASALGAGSGRWEPGLAVGLLVVIVQLFVSKTRAATFATVLVAVLAGLVFETAMISLGLISYAAQWPSSLLPPVWLLALWMVFATCIDATARMLGDNGLIKGALLGAVLAPVTYWAGAGFGALAFPEPLWMPLAATALAWAITTPLLMIVFARMQR